MSDKIRKLFNQGLNFIGSIPNIWSTNQIHIITDGHDWVINEISKNLSGALSQKNLARAKVSSNYFCLSKRILHFNAVPVPKKFHQNKIIMTWYHVNEGDQRLRQMEQVASRIDLLHTTAQSTKIKLSSCGFPPEKIRVIPMGIDLRLFNPATQETKSAIRAALEIPNDVFVIGSFQKDGDGWGEGMNPKMIKGPDIFCDVIERLNQHYPIHALLSGPARGYVKERLTRAGIPFTHSYVSQYAEMNKLYQALDVYLISSRIEGVPMALLESWATGTPLVSTRVGMVADVALDGQNALLADIEDRDKLTENVSKIFENCQLRNQLISKSKQEIGRYDWKIIIERYWNELYLPLLLSLPAKK